MLTPTLTLEQQARAFGATVEQVRAQHLKNAASCEKTANKGRTVGGYTTEQWRSMAENHRRIAGA